MRLRGGLDIVLGPPLQLRDKIACSGLGAASLPDERGRATSWIYADVSAPDRPRSCRAAVMHGRQGLGEQPKKTDKTTRAPKTLRMAHDARAYGQ